MTKNFYTAPTHTAISLALLIYLFPIAGLTAEQTLPDIGSADTSLITQANERKVAEQVMRNLRQADLILDDAELTEYIQNLGHRLSAYSDWNGGEFNFFIIKDMQVNAFALPAGYIGVHAGLFLTTQNEDELAAVLAHEIAHVSQRHYSRGYDFSKQQNIILAAALIAAIAVGGEDSTASSALLLGGMAGTMQSSLAFSRGNEKEADWLGIELLAKSGFDPEAMPRFFERMQQATRYNEGDVPEFLRTHPVTLNRISDAENRASQMKVKHAKPSSEYTLMWHKLATLAGDKTNLQFQPPSAQPGSNEYAQALKLADAGKYPQALAAIEQAMHDSPNQPLIKTAAAEIYRLLQKPDRAIAIYKDLYALYPSQSSITLGYARLLIQNNQAEKAKQILRQALDNTSIHVPQLYQLLADAEMKLGNTALSHRYMSDYYFDTGNPYAAARQIEIALEQKDLSFYEKEELQSRLAKLQEHLQILAKLPSP